MSQHRVSSLLTILKDERAQMLPMVAMMLTVLLGVTGFVIDVGRAYIGYRQLQSATDASALAAAGALPDTTTAMTNANNYSALTGNYNVIPTLSNVGMVKGYPSVTCLTTLQALGLACIGTGGGNAVVVKQTGTVKMTFGALIGFKNLAMTATATAAMRGAVAGPYNVAIVVDTTQSMTSNDNSTTCTTSRISCALGGIVTMLKVLDPCAASGCGGSASNGNFPNAVDKVSIFTYPNITPTTVVHDSDCTGKSISPAPYTFPSATATTYVPTTGVATYQVIGYDSDYRSSNTATTLSTTSTLSDAVGAGVSTCPAMQALGGQGTYFAGAIYAAQASLVAAQAANNKTQNVMIILSDGDASASGSAMTGASTTSGVYPSTKNQCAQAVTAAKAATTAGTQVFTVAYGALTSGCSTDSPSISPCTTMENMASDGSKFFSDYTSVKGSTCTSAAQPTTSLNQIFTEIAGSLTLSRLIPDNTK
jgi:Flp pilus assembly protein TadG